VGRLNEKVCAKGVPLKVADSQTSGAGLKSKHCGRRQIVSPPSWNVARSQSFELLRGGGGAIEHGLIHSRRHRREKNGTLGGRPYLRGSFEDDWQGQMLGRQGQRRKEKSGHVLFSGVKVAWHEGQALVSHVNNSNNNGGGKE